MNIENYLNHPTFGLLFRLCMVNNKRELFGTLYAQRLFFVVTAGTDGLSFQSVTRTEARLLVEERMRDLRRNQDYSEYDRIQKTYQQTFK